MMVAVTDSAAGRAKGVSIVDVMIDLSRVHQLVCYGTRFSGVWRFGCCSWLAALPHLADALSNSRKR